MKTKRKNKFLTFCFSLMPGAAEMYMGFMKTGVSLMLLFFLIIALAGWIHQAVIAMFGVVVWFYSFFHANHLTSLRDEEFDQVEDEYLLGIEKLPEIKQLAGKYHLLVAGVLIFFGVCCLWNSLTEILLQMLPASYQALVWEVLAVGDYVPGILIGIGVIVLGIRMIRGKKEEVQ